MFLRVPMKFCCMEWVLNKRNGSKLVLFTLCVYLLPLELKIMIMMIMITMMLISVFISVCNCEFGYNNYYYAFVIFVGNIEWSINKVLNVDLGKVDICRTYHYMVIIQCSSMFLLVNWSIPYMCNIYNTNYIYCQYTDMHSCRYVKCYYG